jgi:hypothetical protein
MEVATTPVRIADGDVLVQNLGDGALYVSTSDSVSPASGVKLNAGEALAIGTAVPVWAVSDSTADVRVMARSTGLFTGGASSEP